MALSAHPAQASVLQFTGTLSITNVPFLTQGYPLGSVGSFAHMGAGVGVSSTTPNQIENFVSVSGFTGTGTTFVNGTFQPPTLWRFRASGIGDPKFSGTPLNGPMAVRGDFERTFAASTMVALPFTLNGTAGVGLGGTLTRGIAANHATTQFGEWTTGLVQLTGIATSFFGTQATTLSQSGYDARTPSGAGSLQLVTPIRILSSVAGEPDLGGFITLELKFVPEPDSLVLLGAGGALLFGFQRRRAGVLRRPAGPPAAQG